MNRMGLVMGWDRNTVNIIKPMLEKAIEKTGTQMTNQQMKTIEALEGGSDGYSKDSSMTTVQKKTIMNSFIVSYHSIITIILWIQRIN